MINETKPVSDSKVDDHNNDNSYLNSITILKAETIENIYSSSIDGPFCHNFCTIDEKGNSNSNSTHPTLCYDYTSSNQNNEQHNVMESCLPGSCNNILERHQCAQLIPFLAGLDDDENQNTGGFCGLAPTSTVFDYPAFPKACEYCKSTNSCLSNCERPKSYFLKKRPPFMNNEQWEELCNENRKAKEELAHKLQQQALDSQKQSNSPPRPSTQSTPKNSNMTNDNNGILTVNSWSIF